MCSQNPLEIRLPAAPQFPHMFQYAAVQAGIPVWLVHHLNNEHQAHALIHGVRLSLALEFENEWQIAALEEGANHLLALFFENEWQIEALRRGVPAETALLFENEWQVAALEILNELEVNIEHELVLQFTTEEQVAVLEEAMLAVLEILEVAGAAAPMDFAGINE